VTLRAQNRGDEVHIAVIDTGPGIAPEKLPFIFDEFYQSDASLSRKAGGVGLGLTISRRFVEAHHGRIWVESQPGEGSVFTFTLPCGASAVGDAREAPAAMYPELLPNMILVEPDPEVFQITRRQIEAYEWIQVESLKGLELAVRQYKPRAVVVNLSPEEVRQAPEAAGIDAPLIFCSLPRRLSREGELAQLTLLRKPIEMEDLVRELERNGGVRDLLVIDDDRGFIQLLERLITASGRPVELRRAYSGAEGLAAMAEQRPDLVLLDLVMPEVNGMQVLERMRAEASLAGIPVCLVTSGSYELETVTQGGQNILIHQAKGFRSEKVFGYLRALLHQIEPAGGLVEVEENS
jgi:CheY-like chemotaxis protein